MTDLSLLIGQDTSKGSEVASMPQVAGPSPPLYSSAVYLPRTGEEAVGLAIAVAKALGFRLVRRVGWVLRFWEASAYVWWPTYLEVSVYSEGTGVVLMVQPQTRRGRPKGSAHALKVVGAFVERAEDPMTLEREKRLRTVVRWTDIPLAALVVGALVYFWPDDEWRSALFVAWAVIMTPQVSELALSSHQGTVIRRDLLVSAACAGVLVVATVVFLLVRGEPV